MKRFKTFFVILVIVIFSGQMAVAQDYNLSIWDFSGDYDNQSIPDGTISFTLIQDAKGKLTGSGNFDYDSDETDISVDDIPVVLKGHVKTSNNIVKIKLLVKGEKRDVDIDGEYYNLKVEDNISLELDADNGTMVGTAKGKICAKGLGCDKGLSNIEIDLLAGMTGEAALEIDVAANKKGKKLKGDAVLTLSNDVEYALSAKGNYSSKKNETKVSLKGFGGSQGIKLNVNFNEETDNCTKIMGKALGQKIKYKED
jgi:hypothetical protein